MRRGLIGIVAALALLAGACGSDDDTLSESELKDYLVEQGLPEDIANCASEKLGSISVDDEDLADRAADAGFECATESIEDGEVPGVSLPDISIPDISIPDISIDLEE